MFKLFKKDLTLFFHDQRSVILTFLLPVILITLFGFAYGSIGGYDGRSEPVSLLVSDLDQTTSSNEIINRIDSLEDIKTVVSDTVKSLDLVIKGKYAGALIIYKGFQDSLASGKAPQIELLYDRSREMEIGILQQNIIRSAMNDKKSAIGLKWTSVVGEKNDIKLGLIQAVAGTAILMLLFSVAGVGASILEEKENGTINRLLYSPLKVSSILYGKMLFAFFISLLQLTAMFLFAGLVFNLDLSINIPALILMIIATAFAVSGIGVFLAAIAKTRQQAQNLSTIIILIMSAIGGSMIPLFIMPVILQKIAFLSVNYWGIQGFYDIFWRNLPLEEIIPRILVLMSIGVVMTLASIWLFKKRLMKF